MSLFGQVFLRSCFVLGVFRVWVLFVFLALIQNIWWFLLQFRLGLYLFWLRCADSWVIFSETFVVWTFTLLKLRVFIFMIRLFAHQGIVWESRVVFKVDVRFLDIKIRLFVSRFFVDLSCSSYLLRWTIVFISSSRFFYFRNAIETRDLRGEFLRLFIRHRSAWDVFFSLVKISQMPQSLIVVSSIRPSSLYWYLW